MLNFEANYVTQGKKYGLASSFVGEKTSDLEEKVDAVWYDYELLTKETFDPFWVTLARNHLTWIYAVNWAWRGQRTKPDKSKTDKIPL